MRGLAVYVKSRTSFCMGLISRELCGFLFMFPTNFTSLSVLLPFPLLITFIVMHNFWIFSNMDEVFSINPSANVFVSGDFNGHHKDWLTYSGGTDRPGELSYNFSISNDLTQIVNFRTWIPDCDSHSSSLLYFFLLILVFVLQWPFLHWEILIMVLFLFPLTFQ